MYTKIGIQSQGRADFLSFQLNSVVYNFWDDHWSKIQESGQFINYFGHHQPDGIRNPRIAIFSLSSY